LRDYLIAIAIFVNGAKGHSARRLSKRIDHEWAYSDEGACTNQAESFFSRIRRAETGIHHRIAGAYLSSYAAEMAWREDNRRISNGEQYLMVINAALAHPVSRQWKGYWHATRLHESAPSVSLWIRQAYYSLLPVSASEEVGYEDYRNAGSRCLNGRICSDRSYCARARVSAR
jgi:hypothetical protein